MVRHESKLCRGALCAVVALAVAGVAACGGQNGGSAGADDEATGEAPTAGQVRSDAEIAAVASTLNMGEIQQAEIAQAKAQSPEIKSFAQHMISEHGNAERRQAALLGGLGVAPQENEVSRAIRAEAGAMTASLRDQPPGPSFDRAYADSQVAMHQRGLQVLDTQLIPKAERPELRQELVQTRASVARHLAQAQALQASLAAAGQEAPEK